MPKMKELYKRVATDSTLQTKFAKIMEDAEAAGAEATSEKLKAFAKEAGYDITMAEMQDFFKEFEETKEGVLSEAELDQVAGGKGGGSFGFERLFHNAYRNVVNVIENPERFF